MGLERELLSYYGLIPERVVANTSATYKKRRSKTYETSLSRFTYNDIPEEAFPIGQVWVEEGEYGYYIATPEKALCDQLYKIKPATSLKELEWIIFEGLRIYLSDFEELDMKALVELSSHYKSRTLQLLAKYIRRKYKDRI